MVYSVLRTSRYGFTHAETGLEEARPHAQVWSVSSHPLSLMLSALNYFQLDGGRQPSRRAVESKAKPIS